MFKRLCYLPALRLKMFDGGNQGKWCIQCQSQVSKISCRPNEQPETFHACCYLCQIYFTIYDWLIKKFRTSTSHCLSELIVKQATFIYYWWTDAWLLFWILSPNPSLLSHFGCCLFVSSPFLAVTDICSPWDQVHRMQGAKGPLNPSHLLRDFW